MIIVADTWNTAVTVITDVSCSIALSFTLLLLSNGDKF
jgi:hypothetical protein